MTSSLNPSLCSPLFRFRVLDNHAHWKPYRNRKLLSLLHNRHKKAQTSIHCVCIREHKVPGDFGLRITLWITIRHTKAGNLSVAIISRDPLKVPCFVPTWKETFLLASFDLSSSCANKRHLSPYLTVQSKAINLTLNPN